MSIPPQVQATTAASTTPPPTAATSSSASPSIAQFSIIASAPEAVSSQAVANIPQTVASVADTSNAASSTVDVSSAAVTPAVATPPQSEVLQSDTSTPTPAAFTTIGISNPQSSSSATTESAAGSTTTLVAVAGGSDSGSNDSGTRNNTTVAVAGGVIGGLAVIGLIAFFIWFWRRRIFRKRRSTLLTPLGPDPAFGGGMRGEKQPYTIENGSIGPTPRSTKVKAAVRQQYGRIRGRLDRSGSIRSISSGRSVDMNRGNSQFMDTSPMVNGRKGSNASAMSPRNRSSDLTIKERVLGMWGRFRGKEPDTPTFEDQNRNDIFAARGIGGSMKSNASSANKARPLTNKPDFLTLLNMDDRELDREAQRRRVSRTRDGGGGSLGSNLGPGALSLDFGNPFSDANAIPRGNKSAGEFTVSAADNPFSDANAMVVPRQPNTYVSDLRRSRGMSVGAASVDLEKSYDLHGLRVVNQVSRPTSGATGVGGNNNSVYFRDSSTSLESFATKRNKFRSDPFDLEPLSYVSDSPLGQPAMPTANGRYSNTESISIQYQGTVAGNPNVPNVPRIPAAAHTRNVSGSDGMSSRYTSGVSDDFSLDEWSDPGPDVGPGAQSSDIRWEASRRSSTAADPIYSPLGGSNAGPYGNIPDVRSDSRSSGKSSLKMGYAL